MAEETTCMEAIIELRGERITMCGTEEGILAPCKILLECGATLVKKKREKFSELLEPSQQEMLRVGDGLGFFDGLSSISEFAQELGITTSYLKARLELIYNRLFRLAVRGDLVRRKEVLYAFTRNNHNEMDRKL